MEENNETETSNEDVRVKEEPSCLVKKKSSLSDVCIKADLWYSGAWSKDNLSCTDICVNETLRSSDSVKDDPLFLNTHVKEEDCLNICIKDRPSIPDVCVIDKPSCVRPCVEGVNDPLSLSTYANGKHSEQARTKKGNETAKPNTNTVIAAKDRSHRTQGPQNKKHVTKIITYSCPHCNFTTTTRHTLIQHVTLHNAEKQAIRMRAPAVGELYKCPDCKYTATLKYDLACHRLTHNIHTYAKRYKCEQCYFTSTDQHLFFLHRQTHKTYKCSQCKFTSKYKKHLMNHAKKHSSFNPYKCSQCDYSCKLPIELSSHQNTHRGENGVIPVSKDFKLYFK